MSVATPNAKFAVLALAVALAGCGNQPAETPAQSQAPAAAATVAAPVAAAPAYPADFAIDAPIPGGQLGTSMALVGTPSYRAKDDKLVFTVEVTNSGKTPLVTNGKMPVQIAVTLAGPEGVDKAPGTRDFARTRLPLLVPNSKVQVQGVVPVEPMLGLTPRLELVQEGVAFFGKRWKQPTLDLGVYQRCNNAPATLCDATGTPLPRL